MEDKTVKKLKKLNRERIHSIWEIAKNGNLGILTGEERRYAEVMLEHEEEYFNQFEMADLTYEHQYDPGTDENPFLHIALHVVVEDQLEAGEPIEVYSSSPLPLFDLPLCSIKLPQWHTYPAGGTRAFLAVFKYHCGLSIHTVINSCA